MFKQSVQNILARFRREEEGSIAIETVIIIPVLFWAYLSLFSIFDAYRHHSISQKAGYTIGDIISRETNPIDPAFIVGTRNLLQFLTLSHLDDTSIRVSSIKYDADETTYKKDWSTALGNGPAAFSESEITALGNRLPIMKDNEYIILVETWVDYSPPFDTGLASHELVNFVFTRPRYAPRVCWEICN